MVLERVRAIAVVLERVQGYSCGVRKGRVRAIAVVLQRVQGYTCGVGKGTRL